MGKRGPKAGSPKRGSATSVRLDPALRRSLEQAARANGVSLAQEISNRLTLSPSILEQRNADFGNGAANYVLCRLIVRSLDDIQASTGLSWDRHPWAFRHARQAIFALLTIFEPPGKAVMPKNVKPLNDLKAQGASESDIADAGRLIEDYYWGEDCADRAITDFEASLSEQKRGSEETHDRVLVFREPAAQLRKRMKMASEKAVLMDRRKRFLAMLRGRKPA